MTILGIFTNCQLVLDLGNASFKTKKFLRELITKNGGEISYILTKKTDFLVVCKGSMSKGNDSYKSRKATSLNIPVVSEKFVKDCVERSCLLDPDEFLVVGESRSREFAKGKISSKPLPVKKVKEYDLETAQSFKHDSGDCPGFPTGYSICKFAILSKENPSLKNDLKEITCLEIHVGTEKKENSNVSSKMFRVMMSTLVKQVTNSTSCYEYPVKNSIDALHCYETLVKRLIDQQGFKRLNGMPAIEGVGSSHLRMLLDEMKSSAGIIDPEVVRLVETIWMDSLGELKNILEVEPKKITPEQLRNGIISLKKIQEALKEGKSTLSLSDEFYKILPHNKDHREPITTLQILAKKQELCQILKDILLVGETAWNSVNPNTILSQYSSLNCSIMKMDPSDDDCKILKDVLLEDEDVVIHNIFRVQRSIEKSTFRNDLPNTQLLFHASSSKNFVGILSRGLLLPLVVTNELGGNRRDEGNLGSGIYFTDSLKTASKYADSSPNRGSRLLLVNDVALGDIYKTSKRMTDLTSPPDGYNSVKGIKGPSSNKLEETSDFEQNEFVIYATNQQMMRYIVEFTLKNEKRIEHEYLPQIISLQENISRNTESDVSDLMDEEKPKSEMQAGLIFKSKENISAQLDEVHVRATIIDLVTEVTIFQSYRNESSAVVEAKYVFPLADNAAVCGFEAFINDKHVVGVVKEKETAHKEYKKAISEGHGAYLMDEEERNVFTVSVGNIPPSARVVIKITYISELNISSDEDCKILFSLPGSISPWDEKSIKLSNSITQTTTQSVSVSNQEKSSLMISVDMPFDIMSIDSPTHKIATKKTASKACVKLNKSSYLNRTGFLLSIKMAEIHVPRIWIEKENQESLEQAAMVTFFPEFDVDVVDDYDSLILLDMSNSMHSVASNAKSLARSLIDSLPSQCRFNVILFGSNLNELFVNSELASDALKEKAKDFILSASASYGGSDIFYFLNSIYNLCTPFEYFNVFLLSDGHLSESESLLQISHKISNASKSRTRIFSFGIGSSPDSHLLQSISLITGGCYEHFNPSIKSTWKEQMRCQISKAGQPALTNIYIDWSSYDQQNTIESSDNKIVQVPEKVNSLFNGSRLVAYSFQPGCVQATLRANIQGQEFSTVVTASDLCISTGKTLHRLAAKAIFKEYENGVLADDIFAHHMKKSERKESIISLSVKYSVVTKYTSFVAVEKREKGENLSVSYGPSVSDLVQGAFTDIIPEIEWMDEEVTLEDNIDDLLKKVYQAESSSIIQARQLISDAKDLYKNLPNPDLARKLLICATASRLEEVTENSESWKDLKNIFLKNNRSLNYEFVNKICNETEKKLKEAAEELVSTVWPDHCTVRLASFPNFVRPLIIGAFTELEINHPKFLEDDLKGETFWEEFGDLHSLDKDGNVSKDIVLNVERMIQQMNQALDGMDDSYWAKKFIVKMKSDHLSLGSDELKMERAKALLRRSAIETIPLSIQRKGIRRGPPIPPLPPRRPSPPSSGRIASVERKSRQDDAPIQHSVRVRYCCKEKSRKSQESIGVLRGFSCPQRKENVKKKVQNEGKLPILKKSVLLSKEVEQVCSDASLAQRPEIPDEVIDMLDCSELEETMEDTYLGLEKSIPPPPPRAIPVVRERSRDLERSVDISGVENLMESNFFQEKKSMRKKKAAGKQTDRAANQFTNVSVEPSIQSDNFQSVPSEKGKVNAQNISPAEPHLPKPQSSRIQLSLSRPKSGFGFASAKQDLTIESTSSKPTHQTSLFGSSRPSPVLTGFSQSNVPMSQQLFGSSENKSHGVFAAPASNQNISFGASSFSKTSDDTSQSNFPVSQPLFGSSRNESRGVFAASASNQNISFGASSFSKTSDDTSQSNVPMSQQLFGSSRNESRGLFGTSANISFGASSSSKTSSSSEPLSRSGFSSFGGKFIDKSPGPPDTIQNNALSHGPIIGGGAPRTTFEAAGFSQQLPRYSIDDGQHNIRNPKPYCPPTYSKQSYGLSFLGTSSPVYTPTSPSFRGAPVVHEKSSVNFEENLAEGMETETSIRHDGYVGITEKTTELFLADEIAMDFEEDDDIYEDVYGCFKDSDLDSTTTADSTTSGSSDNSWSDGSDSEDEETGTEIPDEPENLEQREKPRTDPLYPILAKMVKLYKSSDSEIVDDLIEIMEPDGFFKFPEDEDSEEFDIFGSQIKRIILKAGASSLGIQALSTSLDMLLTAIGIVLLRILSKKYCSLKVRLAIEKASKWLEAWDKVHPFLYSRLELGTNWDTAARKVICNVCEEVLKNKI